MAVVHQAARASLQPARGASPKAKAKAREVSHTAGLKKLTRQSPGSEEIPRRLRAADGRPDGEAVFEQARSLLSSPPSSGSGCDPARGLELLKQAAHRQHAGALELLGEMYRGGGRDRLCLRQDPVQASRCFSQAAGIRREEVALLRLDKEKREYRLLEASGDFNNALWQLLLLREMLAAWGYLREQRQRSLAACVRAADRRVHRSTWALWIAETRRWQRWRALASRRPSADLASMQRVLSTWQRWAVSAQRGFLIIGSAICTQFRRHRLRSVLLHWSRVHTYTRNLMQVAHARKQSLWHSILASWRVSAIRWAHGGRLLAKALTRVSDKAVGPLVRHWKRQADTRERHAAVSRLRELEGQISKLEGSHAQFREQASQEINHWRRRLSAAIISNAGCNSSREEALPTDCRLSGRGASAMAA